MSATTLLDSRFTQLDPSWLDQVLRDRGHTGATVIAIAPDHVRAAWLLGFPAEVAKQVQPYLDAGIDWVMPFDYLPVVGDPADAPRSVGWMIELAPR